MKVLIVKISSMGDVIHTLPALTDAVNAIPNITFDWVVAPQFADIPHMHSAVRKIIACPFRKWRHRYFAAFSQGEMKRFLLDLRKDSYDLVIDAQSALKSALIAKAARGPSVGFDKNSVRERGAQWFYKKCFSVPKEIHAVTRLRSLFSQALGYSWNQHALPDFGINTPTPKNFNLALPQKYLIAIPNTTWPTKHWPLEYWRELINQINQQGIAVVLPWGNEKEKQRVKQLTLECHHALMLPKLSLLECKHVIQNALAAVCVDTGLGHLTAALGTPAVHLYGPTDPHQIGALGKQQVLLRANFSCLPTCKRLCHDNKTLHNTSSCLTKLTPQLVWDSLKNLLR